MHEKQIRSDDKSKKSAEYAQQQHIHGEITSGVFLVLFFAASIISIIVSNFIY